MQSKCDVHLLVVDGFADWEPAFATAHVARPAPGMPPKYRVRAVGLTKKPVKSLAGLTVTPDLELSTLSAADSAMLILPGADQWVGQGMDSALTVVRRFIESSVPVAAICGATLGLARAGMLDDRRHTSNDPGFLASSGYRGGALYVHEPAVEDRNVITASAMASLEFARLILARLEVFPACALSAWYDLYKTGNPASYFAFMEAISHGGTA